jgi:hypothetical protein
MTDLAAERDEGATDRSGAQGARRSGQAVFPVYLFDAKIGVLYFNAFGRRMLKLRARREVAEIIAHLQTEAQAGRIPLDGVVVGWPGDGRKPKSAVDASDEAVMRSWRKRAFKISLRVDLRSDLPPFDHDAQVMRVYMVSP